MDLVKAHEMALHEIARFTKLADWTFAWNRCKRSIGRCRYGCRKIELSRLLTERESDESLILDTIRHEIAHALAGPGYGHGPVWQGLARLVGCKVIDRVCQLSNDAEPIPVKYALVVDIDGREEVLKTYYRRPANSFLESLPRRCVRGRPETKGMVRLKQIG